MGQKFWGAAAERHCPGPDITNLLCKGPGGPSQPLPPAAAGPRGRRTGEWAWLTSNKTLFANTEWPDLAHRPWFADLDPKPSIVHEALSSARARAPWTERRVPSPGRGRAPGNPGEVQWASEVSASQVTSGRLGLSAGATRSIVRSPVALTPALTQEPSGSGSRALEPPGALVRTLPGGGDSVSLQLGWAVRSRSRPGGWGSCFGWGGGCEGQRGLTALSRAGVVLSQTGMVCREKGLVQDQELESLFILSWQWRRVAAGEETQSRG